MFFTSFPPISTKSISMFDNGIGPISLIKMLRGGKRPTQYLSTDQGGAHTALVPDLGENFECICLTCCKMQG